MSNLISEWSPVNFVLIAWPYEDSDWSENINLAEQCYFDMLFSFLKASNVLVLLHPSIELRQWQENFNNKRTNLNKTPYDVTLINEFEYNDTWVRDYAALSTSKELLNFQFNGWGDKYPSRLDNSIAINIAHHFSKTTRSIPFVLEGGAIDVNDEGVLLANKTCVVNNNRNSDYDLPSTEKLLTQTLGLSAIEWLDVSALTGDDTDGHIDTIARFANNNTLVYCGENLSHPDSHILSVLKQQLSDIAARRKWNLVALPTPVIHSTIYPDVLLPATYANFLICNGFVFVPIYGVDEDTQALDILSHVFKRFSVIAIRCEALLEQHGSLHCATMQIC